MLLNSSSLHHITASQIGSLLTVTGRCVALILAGRREGQVGSLFVDDDRSLTTKLLLLANELIQRLVITRAVTGVFKILVKGT